MVLSRIVERMAAMRTRANGTYPYNAYFTLSVLRYRRVIVARQNELSCRQSAFSYNRGRAKLRVNIEPCSLVVLIVSRRIKKNRHVSAHLLIPPHISFSSLLSIDSTSFHQAIVFLNHYPVVGFEAKPQSPQNSTCKRWHYFTPVSLWHLWISFQSSDDVWLHALLPHSISRQFQADRLVWKFTLSLLSSFPSQSPSSLLSLALSLFVLFHVLFGIRDIIHGQFSKLWMYIVEFFAHFGHKSQQSDARRFVVVFWSFQANFTLIYVLVVKMMLANYPHIKYCPWQKG